MNFDDKGNELPDPTPIAVPAGFARPETLAQQMARLIRSHEYQRRLSDAGAETFQEANDFDVDDEEIEVNPTRYERMAEEHPQERELRDHLRSKGRVRAAPQVGPEDDDADDDGEPDSGPRRPGASRRSGASVLPDDEEGRPRGTRQSKQRPARRADDAPERRRQRVDQFDDEDEGD